MVELTESVKFSKQVKEELDKRKEDGGHSSYDSLLRELLGMNKKRRR